MTHDRAQPIAVASEDIADLRAMAQNAIRDGELLALLCEISPGPYGASPRVLALLDAVEIGLACLAATHRALCARIRADRRVGFAGGELSEAEKRFACLMAAYVAMCEAGSTCQAACQIDARTLPPPSRHLPLDDYRSLLTGVDSGGNEGRETGGEAEIVAGLAGDLAQYVTFYRDHANHALRVNDERLAQCVASYFTLVAATSRRLGEVSDYRSMVEAMRDASLSVNGAEYRGFGRETALPEVEEAVLLPILPKDIVGNREVLDAGLALARAVAGFDLERGENPRPIRNPVLFIMGAPGCGKTVTAHAIGNYFLDLCRRHQIPARFRIIRRTDWASHFQNKSASELLRIFRSEIFDFQGVAGVYWPDIDTAFAARGDPSIRAEEKAVLGTLFGLLDGTIGPKNGKWFLIADANYLTMDQAALSRLTQDPHYARGPQTVADFCELLRDKKLANMRNHFPLGDDEWQKLGQRCVDAGLSGRAVDNIAGKLLAEVDEVEVPDEYFSLSYDDKVAVLEERRKDLDFAHLSRVLERYIEFEKDADDRARSERFEHRVREIREHLAARVAAVAGAEE